MRNRLIRLGPSQLVIMGAGLLIALFVPCLALSPSLEDLYAREYALSRMEQRWGFRFGTFRVQRNGVDHEYEGIVSLTPGGRLARLGVRLHDMFLEYRPHDTAALAIYHTLRASERGEATKFEVANVDDWAAGRDRQAFRTIDVQPAR